MRKALLYLLTFVVFCPIFICSANDFKSSSEAVSDIQAADQIVTAETFKRLNIAVPPPKLSDSVERRNLSKRLTRFNVSDKISYIYLINTGKIMGFFIVKGKVSSVNSMLTCTDQLVDDGQGNTGTGPSGRDNVHVVASPDLDGSYGSNGDAIFFFNDKDIYVEWNGKYMLSDQYIKLNQPPILQVKADKDNL
ncbi:MAG: hypothetical protein US30_C0006G0034 [Candidatus Moranbacteria bacterium GW2011_GWF2_36_839]|nr:MAG: hypothetical protein US27_C0006G0041 [Candidatus Moranbacteria bacterium GW2011_GWF1_36_78]KKQ17145.1 MAG: hypothetical protein US30_C0006G0034 [Candidatus Moranbacteria bacterium GW2011_GWF2_36_839]HAT74137.1 hypothetical protein [Candidatus Moranbacteria bacterium]HBY10655.1 hypothetical protein [Candidatus Moranbacteria bacterium]